MFYVIRNVAESLMHRPNIVTHFCTSCNLIVHIHEVLTSALTIVFFKEELHLKSKLNFLKIINTSVKSN